MRTNDARIEEFLGGITLCRDSEAQSERTKMLNEAWGRKTHYSRRYRNSYRKLNGSLHSPFNRHNAELWDASKLKEPAIESFLNVLCELLPTFLRAACEFAAFCEPDIFPDALPQTQVKDLATRRPYLDLNETPLSRFCRLSGMNSSLVLNRLVDMGASPDAFLSGILNSTSGGLLLAVDHLARQRTSINFFRATMPAHDRKRVLSNILAASGCDLTNNYHFSRYPTNRALQFYGPGMCIRDCGYEGVMSQYSHFLSLKIPSKSQLLMLLISFYFIVCRILTDAAPTMKVFSMRGVPRQLSYSAAAGCYIAMRRLTAALEFREWNSLDPFEIFPDFPSFLEVLRLVLRGQATLVACCDCNTPYVIFDDRLRVKGHPELTRMRCPRCHSESEYEQDIGE
jgi:hypothetical protein